MKTQNYFLLLALACLSACAPQRSTPTGMERIPIDIQKNSALRLSAFAESIEIIPLETTDESVFANIEKIIERDGRYYLFVDIMNPRLMVFDKDGRFLRKIDRRGGGPGEYVGLETFTLAKDGSIKLSCYGKIITCDSLGNYRHEKTTPASGYIACDIIPFVDNTFLALNRASRSGDNRLLCVLNENDEFGNNFFPVSREASAISDTYITNNAFYNYGDDWYFTYSFCDTIYTIDADRNVSHAYYADYGDKMFDMDVLDDIPSRQVAEYMMKTMRGLTYACSIGMGVNDKFVWVSSSYTTDNDKSCFFTLYNKSTHKTLTGDALIDDIYMQGITRRLKLGECPLFTSDDYLIWSLSASALLSYYEAYKKTLSPQAWNTFRNRYPRLVKICSTLTEDDNHVLLRINLK
jgi:hypothetical protein